MKVENILTTDEKKIFEYLGDSYCVIRPCQMRRYLRKIRNTKEERHQLLLELIALYERTHDQTHWLYAEILAGYLGYPEAYLQSLIKILYEDWHEQHEDIVFMFEMMRYEPAIPVLCHLIERRFDYLDYDDSMALGVKCAWALGDTRNMAVTEQLALSAEYDDREEVRNAAQENLDYILNDELIRGNKIDSAIRLLDVPSEYGLPPFRDELLREFHLTTDSISAYTIEELTVASTEHKKYRFHAAVFLAKSFGYPDNYAQRATEWLLEDWHKSHAALVDDLARLHYQPAIDVIKQQLDRSDETEDRIILGQAVADALGRFATPEAITALDEIVRSKLRVEIRDAALENFERIQGRIHE